MSAPNYVELLEGYARLAEHHANTVSLTPELRTAYRADAAALRELAERLPELMKVREERDRARDRLRMFWRLLVEAEARSRSRVTEGTTDGR